MRDGPTAAKPVTSISSSREPQATISGGNPVSGRQRSFLRPNACVRPVRRMAVDKYNVPFTADDTRWMRRALELAVHARDADGEVPVGAVLVLNDEIVGEGWNRNITLADASAHAEIGALREAGARLKNHRIPDSTLYVTLEPCAMCAMALVHARVARVVYAASDPKTGAAGSVFDTLISPHHNHRIAVQGGLLSDESAQLLREFFRARRV